MSATGSATGTAVRPFEVDILEAEIEDLRPRVVPALAQYRALRGST